MWLKFIIHYHSFHQAVLHRLGIKRSVPEAYSFLRNLTTYP
jgi:hypothetical protein